MKYLVIFIAAMLAFYAIPGFLPSPEAHQRALDAGFTEEQIALGREYFFDRQLLGWPATVLEFALLLVLVAYSRRLTDGCSRLVGGWWLPTLLLVGLFCVLLQEALNLPFALARLELTRYWGLTRQSPEDWLQQHLLGLAVSNGIAAVITVGFYVLLRYLPRTWWIVCSLATPVLGMLFAWLMPIYISPLFNKFEPLEQSKWKELRPDVDYLLQKAKVDVQEVLVVDASRQGGHTNAYFTGFGSTRRIVLYDTLLKDHYDKVKGPRRAAEVESILGHELGHWLHHHIVKGIMLASLASALGFYLLFRFLGWARGRPPCYLRDAADPAGLPLILLCSLLASWATMPAQNLVSRYFERQADEMSLELAGQPQAFIEAERKLAVTNIGVLDPHPLRVFLFYSHPPAAARIEMARNWLEHNK